MTGYVVNQGIKAIEITIVNRKGSRIISSTIEANSFERLFPGEYYLTTYINSVDSPNLSTEQVLCNGTNAILIS